jgi:hypothetical protein
MTLARRSPGNNPVPLRNGEIRCTERRDEPLLHARRELRSRYREPARYEVIGPPAISNSLPLRQSGVPIATWA